MADSNESLEIELSDSEKDRIISKIKGIVNCGNYTEDWTYSVNNIKNQRFREIYICGEEEYKKVINKLSKENFYEAERNNSVKARHDSRLAKQVMYKFILEETFLFRCPEDEDEKKISVYVKITFAFDCDDSVIIVSFHESLRSLEEELENKMKAKGQS